MSKKRRILILTVVLIFALSLVLYGNLTVGSTNIDITSDNLPMSFHGFRIAHVSDLHNSHLWKQVVHLLQVNKPDIICITGDMVDFNNTNVDIALAFAAEAVKIAPCYYVTGNHEVVIGEKDYEKLISGLEMLGVCVLDNEAVILERGDEEISLVGTTWGSSLYQGELSEYEGYKLLLAHDPQYFESYQEAGYDLVLTGHVHGGQFRVPLIGGLYGPGQGLFPKYDSGLYSTGDCNMVVSRGVGNSAFPVRLNNRPEVIFITLRT